MAAFAKLVSLWLILLGVSPFTTPFATCDLVDPGNLTGYGAGLVVKADTAPDESLAIPVPATPLWLVSAVVALDSFQSTDQLLHARRTSIVLRL